MSQRWKGNTREMEKDRQRGRWRDIREDERKKKKRRKTTDQWSTWIPWCLLFLRLSTSTTCLNSSTFDKMSWIPPDYLYTTLGSIPAFNPRDSSCNHPMALSRSAHTQRKPPQRLLECPTPLSRLFVLPGCLVYFVIGTGGYELVLSMVLVYSEYKLPTLVLI